MPTWRRGQLRCDCNISVSTGTQPELGAKVEIKNMNSISGVRRALALRSGASNRSAGAREMLVQETRRWDDDAGQTFVMRTKEMAHDYRYLS